MTWLTELRRFFCRHSSPIRESRVVNGITIRHFVCPSCGHAEPQVGRTPEEYAKAKRVGAVRLPKGRVVRDNVIPMARRRG